jgi:hypothetical protein
MPKKKEKKVYEKQKDSCLLGVIYELLGVLSCLNNFVSLGFQVPTLGIDLSFVSTSGLLTSSAPQMLLSRLPLLPLNLVWRLKLPLQILESCLLLQCPLF